MVQTELLCVSLLQIYGLPSTHTQNYTPLKVCLGTSNAKDISSIYPKALWYLIIQCNICHKKTKDKIRIT